MIKSFFSLFTLFILFSTVEAQGPPISLDTPVLLGLNGGGIRTFVKYNSFENSESLIQPVAIPYNITTELQFGLVQPVILYNNSGKEIHSGLGNLILFGKFSLLEINGVAKTFRTLLNVKQSFRTGTKSLNPGFTETQISIVSGYITIDYGLYTNLGYSFLSNNFNNFLSYDFGVGLPLLQQSYPPYQFNVYFELNGKYYMDSGKNILLFSPGFQFITSQVFLFETNIQIPLINEFNKLKYSASFGIRYLIF